MPTFLSAFFASIYATDFEPYSTYIPTYESADDASKYATIDSTECSTIEPTIKTTEQTAIITTQ